VSAPLSPLAPAPEPGPAIPVDVRPGDYYRVAQDFVDSQNRAMRAYTALTRGLGELTGAAGNDEPAQKFANSYSTTERPKPSPNSKPTSQRTETQNAACPRRATHQLAHHSTKTYETTARGPQ
jgi:hypothetical protein